MSDWRGAGLPQGGAETVLGIDNVPLELPIAGVGSRILAALLDYLIQAALQIAWVVAVIIGMGSFLKSSGSLVLYFSGAFAIDWAYFAGAELLMGGRTPGKKALRLRVVTREGGTPARSALLVRNLLRIADLIVGLPLMAFDPLARRLGDRLAGTVVVHEGLAGQDMTLRRVPERWSAADVALVESLLARSNEIEAPRVESFARRLVDWIDRDHPAFFEGIDRAQGPLEMLRRAFQAEKR